MESPIGSVVFLVAAALILLGVVALLSGFILRKRWLAGVGILLLLIGIAVLFLMDIFLKLGG